MKKRNDKAELERISELMNKLGKYRPKIVIQPRMLYDEVWLDVLDLAIKSKENNWKLITTTSTEDFVSNIY